MLRVGIKRVDGGCFSTWANEELAVGEVLEAMAPMGNFHTAIEPGRRRSYLGFAGGSGITPLLGIIKTVLAEERQADFTLVYANRSAASIMFREELEDLKNAHLGRLNLVHILESGAPDIELFAGRLNGAKCAALFAGWIDVASADQAFVCGPEPMMLAVTAALKAHGLDDDQIKFELFASAQPRRARRRKAPVAQDSKGDTCSATILLDGARPGGRDAQAGPVAARRGAGGRSGRAPCLQGRGLLDLPGDGARGRGRDGGQPRAGGRLPACIDWNP